MTALALLWSCEGDDAAGPQQDAIGGWTNADAHLYVCVADDGRMWLGDSKTELGGEPAPCSVSGAAGTFTCTDPDDDSTFSGTLQASSDELTLVVEGCSGVPSDCQSSYARDSSVRCDD